MGFKRIYKKTFFVIVPFFAHAAFEPFVHINIMLLRLFVQLPVYFPVLLCYSLVDIRLNLGTSFVLILSYVTDRRELWLSEHILENLFSSLVRGAPEEI